MKRSSSIRRSAAIALGVAFLLAACRNPLLRTAPTASVTIVVPSPGKSRSLVPSFSNIANYGWSASGPGGASQAKPAAPGGSATFSDLTPGSWTFGAIAYDSSGHALGSGSAAATIASGSNASISIRITMNGAGSGSGNLDITVVWPSDVDILTAAISNGSLNPISVVPGSPTNQAEITNAAPLSAGPHTLTLNFFRGANPAGSFAESVNVFDGLTTDHWIDSDGTAQPAWTIGSAELLDAGCSLASLLISPANGYSFSPATTAYDLSISQPGYFTFTPTASLEGQRIQYSWNAGAAVDLISGTAQGISFAPGVNDLAVVVWAPDRSSKKTYNLAVRAHTLSYLPNGAAGSPAAFTSVFTGGSVALGANSGNWASPGYSFAGWNTQADGLGGHYAAGGIFYMPAVDFSLYAEWIPSALALILDSIHNGGTIALPSMLLSASQLAMVKAALLGAVAPVNLDLSALVNSFLPSFAFSGCSMLAGITLPPALMTIGSGCFADCTGLGNLAIPDAVTTLGDGFVSNCSNLQTLYLGASVGTIGNDTFAGALPALTAINVSASSSTLIDDGGVLYSTVSNTLEKYPPNRPGSSYTALALSNLNTENNSVLGCSNLALIIFPAHVAQIFNYSFDGSVPTIRFLNSTPPVFVAPAAFSYSIPPPMIQVPAGTTAAYAAALGLDPSFISVYP